MYIEALALNNYRNYSLVDIELSKGTNILYGDNAQGKTNILESIYMAATTKSHRSSRDRDIKQQPRAACYATHRTHPSGRRESPQHRTLRPWSHRATG